MKTTYDQQLKLWKDLRQHFYVSVSRNSEEWHSELLDMMTKGNDDHTPTGKLLDTYINYGTEAAIRFCEVKVAMLEIVFK